MTTPLAFLSLASILAIILLMPTLFLMILAALAFLPAGLTLIKNSRRAALSVDVILLTLLLASHVPRLGPASPAGALDIVRLILILSFNEFSSLYSDTRRLEADYKQPDADPIYLSTTLNASRAIVRRSLLASGILLATLVISEVYYLAAQGTSSSLYSIYGVAAGLMLVIAFLFLLLNVASRRQ